MSLTPTEYQTWRLKNLAAQVASAARVQQARRAAQRPARRVPPTAGHVSAHVDRRLAETLALVSLTEGDSQRHLLETCIAQLPRDSAELAELVSLAETYYAGPRRHISIRVDADTLDRLRDLRAQLRRDGYRVAARQLTTVALVLLAQAVAPDPN